MEQIAADLIVGSVVSTNDLSAARAFYERIFRTAVGEWHQQGKSLAFHTKEQTIQFQKGRPRSLGDAGQHQAYRVPEDCLRRLADDLISAGHQVNWWREDHPSEQQITAYVKDPSGNQVQLTASSGNGLLIDHSGIVVHDLELTELFYVKALGGIVDSYHGWSTEDREKAAAWGEGKDPCAPWTRRADLSYRTRKRIALPNTQLFVRFGPTRVGIILAGKHFQEPPEEIVRGSPRLVFRSRNTVKEATAYLSELRISVVSLRHDGHRPRFERDGSSIFLRDPCGNFVQLECTG